MPEDERERDMYLAEHGCGWKWWEFKVVYYENQAEWNGNLLPPEWGPSPDWRTENYRKVEQGRPERIDPYPVRLVPKFSGDPSAMVMLINAMRGKGWSYDIRGGSEQPHACVFTRPLSAEEWWVTSASLPDAVARAAEVSLRAGKNEGSNPP